MWGKLGGRRIARSSRAAATQREEAGATGVAPASESREPGPATDSARVRE